MIGPAPLCDGGAGERMAEHASRSIARRTLFALGGALTASPAPAQGALPRDLMPRFWAVFDRHAASGMDARALAIRDEFFLPNIASYRDAGIGRVDLGQWLRAFVPMADAVRRLSLGFPAQWTAHAARFAQVLPDTAPAPLRTAARTELPEAGQTELADAARTRLPNALPTPLPGAAPAPSTAATAPDTADSADPILSTPAAGVTLLPSFFWFDARVRIIPSGPALFVGLDGVVRVHGENADLAILLDHESFHLYHHQVNASLLLPGGDPLWLGIWKEGLAVHACAVLRPGASRKEVLLGDANLAAIDAALLRRVAGEVLPVLGASTGEARARYLSYGYRGDIPARSGYVLGLEIAARVAARRGLGLPALARLPASEVEIILREEVAALA
jgi:hypothetical protein